MAASPGVAVPHIVGPASLVHNSRAWRAKVEAKSQVTISGPPHNGFVSGSSVLRSLGGSSRDSSHFRRGQRRRHTAGGARCRVATIPGNLQQLRHPGLWKNHELDLDIPTYNDADPTPIDLLVVGAGPAGLSVGQRVSAAGMRVVCIDPIPKSVWPNNYGVWVDEFEEMGLLDCLDYTWPRAVVWLDDGDKRKLSRPYGRVNRVRLKTKMLGQCAENGVEFYQDKVDRVSHSSGLSSVFCSDGKVISARVVLDATGHSRRLVEYDQEFDPGYQAAYGIVAEVDHHPFDMDAMLFMDWRDSHLAHDPLMKERNRLLPTFLYAMPFSETKVFLEETSLVARPGVPFDECVERLEARLKHLGVTVKSIEEEEFCLIPMGGVLPTIPQRVLGIGGTAGMVHPSTGYMVARTLAAAPLLADSLVQHLGGPRTAPTPLLGGAVEPVPAVGSSVNGGVATQVVVEAPVRAPPAPSAVPESLDDVSAKVWADLWPLDRKQQREFFCFGMDVLLKLDLHGTRRFFSAFFSLKPYHWHGFLSSRLYLAELIMFGLSLFRYATNTARVEIVGKGIPGLLVMIDHLVKMR